MPSAAADFAAYVEQSKAQIAAANLAIGKELGPQVIEDRAPFELAPDPERCPRTADGRHERAVLLIHGLGGQPYAMRALAERFAAACYLARAILLPGHGTVPGDLLEVGYEDWVEATRARRAAASQARPSDSIWSAFRAGGTLALDYALGEPKASDPRSAGWCCWRRRIATRPATASRPGATSPRVR